jgi:flagellar basal-body rod modification protein FlgD
MPILSTTPALAAVPPVGAPAASRTAKQTMSQQDFLKLLTMQLKNQDPMKPMDDNSFVTTMAQFTGLEQSSQMITSLKGMGDANKMIAASSMIGREVTVRDNTGAETTGIVDAVESSAKGLQLRMGTELFSFDAVTRVAPGQAKIPPADVRT